MGAWLANVNSARLRKLCKAAETSTTDPNLMMKNTIEFLGEGKEKGRHMNWGQTDDGIDVLQAEGKKNYREPRVNS